MSTRTLSGEPDWPSIRAAAVMVGVRQAARQAAANLPEVERNRFVERVMKRAARQGWLKQAQEVRQTAALTRPAATSAPTVSGADIVAGSMAEIGRTTRFDLAKSAARGAEHAAKLSGDEILERAQPLRALVAAADDIHGWSDGHGEGGGVININLMCMELPTVQGRTIDVE